MTQLLEIRTKLIEIYQKTETYVVIAFKLLFYFLAFNALRKTIHYNARLSGFAVVLCLTVISAFLPPSITVAVMVFYIALQLYSASPLIAATVLVIALILFCFFLRFASSYGNAVIAMPLLMGMKIPYVLPICLGLFSTPITVIPVCVGVFAYYFLKGITANMITVEQVAAADNPFGFYISVLDSVVKNEAMLASMIVFSLVIVAVYIVRNIKMDYSFEISVAVGAGTSMIGFIIMMLRYDIGVGVFSVCLFSVISGLIAVAVNFIYRPLFYAGTEQVQFEDDYYYYYVKAVPKIKVAGSKINVRHVVTRRTSTMDEDFGDELDDVDSGLAFNSDNALSGAKGRVLAGEPDEDEDWDELSDMEYKAYRSTRASDRTNGLKTAKKPSSAVKESDGPVSARRSERRIVKGNTGSARQTAAERNGAAVRKNSAAGSDARGTQAAEAGRRPLGGAKHGSAADVRGASDKRNASKKHASSDRYSGGYARRSESSEDDF